LRSVIFQRVPELDLRRSILTRYMSRAGRPLHRTGLGSPQASLFPTHPPFLIFHDLPLSFIFLYCWRNVLVCLFPIQTRVSDRSHLVTSDATMIFPDARSRPENSKDTPENRTGDLRLRRKPVRITHDSAPPYSFESFEVFLVSN
jgi:hypothetical protein